MKICVSYIKNYKKGDKFVIRRSLVRELIEAGIPEDVAELINEQDTIMWRNWEIDGDTIFVAQVIKDED